MGEYSKQELHFFISVSFRDVFVIIINKIYNCHVNGALNKYSEYPDKNTLKNTLLGLAKILDGKCPLGLTIDNFLISHKAFSLISKLRNRLVHHSFMSILYVKGDMCNPHIKVTVESKWTPTGKKLSLPEYAKFAFYESIALINDICNCIASDPIGCIKEK